jgi:hypothetical protein
MLASAILITIVLLASPSIQAPVKPSSSPPQSVSSSTSLYNFVSSRPLSDKVEALEQFRNDFAAHPDVKRIDLNSNKINIAAQFQALRGNVVDRSWNTKLTKTVNDYLKRSKAKEDVIESVNALNYARRRGVARFREKRKREAMTEGEIDERRRRKGQLRLERMARSKEMEAKGLEKAHTGQESFDVSLDKRLGDRHLNAFDIARESEHFRHTHFKTSQAHINALDAYMQSKKIPLHDISLAIARQKQLKEKSYPVQSRIQKTTMITPAKAGTSNIASSPRSSSTTHLPESRSTDNASLNASSDKSTVDQLDETPWWDHAGW